MAERAKGRLLSDFPNLNEAGKKLRNDAREGVACEFESNLPETDRTIDARFVRYLALGGCEKSAVHERGIWIKGAIIKGDLDFTGCEDVRPIALEYCRIEGR